MNVVVTLPSCSQFRSKKADFSSFLGVKIDAFVHAMCETMRHEISSGEHSTATWDTVISAVKAGLLPWLTGAAGAFGRKLKLSDIDTRLLESFAADLRLRNSYSTASTKFTSAVILLQAMGRLGYVRPYSEIRVVAAFPGVGAAQIPTLPYSKRERNEVLKAVATDFRDIRDGIHSTIVAGSLDSLVIGLILLALPTGMNLTSLLELSRDAMHPHPLRKNEWILVANKRRGNKMVSAQAKWSDVIAEMRSLDLHLVPVYRQLLLWSDGRAALSLKKYRNYLFIRPPVGDSGSKCGRPVPLTAGDFRRVVQKMNARYNITSDTGDRLTVSTRRIRATVAARIYDLSGGDPFVVAKVLGNLPRTTSISYLEPEFGASVAFLKAVKAFASKLKQGVAGAHQPTAVGDCSDPLNGRFAPKDGVTFCQRWLNCFQCPNQCITGEEDALWRLYSFYWLLQARRKALQRLPIAGQVRFVLHVIDTVVTKRFGAKARRARDRAREHPHPIWAEVKAIDALFVGYGNG
jgi:hypothetical protein